MPTRQSLADGQVQGSESEIFTAATKAGSAGGDVYVAGVQTIVTQLSFFNTSAVTQTVILYLKRAAVPNTSRKIRQWELAQNESCSAIDSVGAIRMMPGDQLTAESTTTDVVDFTMSGEVEMPS